jgi:hypothetical protein
VSFKAAGTNECISFKDGKFSFQSCDGGSSSSFWVSYATDGLVVEVPNPSQFTKSQGGAWGCCNNKEKRCCHDVTRLGDAEYLSRI